ncbi:MAG: AIR synthase-related protein, partial [Janthinobacterium lividum]
GGLLENVPRVLPVGCHARIDAGSWPQSPLFAWLQAQGRIEPGELARTFNCGIGMVLAVAAAAVESLIVDLTEAGETVHVIGTVEAGEKGCTVYGDDQVWNAQGPWSVTHRA